jgi:acetylornithine/succinyldiaminopimelate/putrescine aminotransferase
MSLTEPLSWFKCSYHPVPIVFSEAKGSSVWDPEGNRYLDFLAAYSAVNQVRRMKL